MKPKKLPKWAWVAAAGVGLLMAYFILRKSGQSAAPAPGDTSPAPPPSGDDASSGGSGGGFSFAPFQSTLDSQLAPLQPLQPLSSEVALDVPDFQSAAATNDDATVPTATVATDNTSGAFIGAITNYKPGVVGGYTGQSAGGVLLGHGAVIEETAPASVWNVSTTPAPPPSPSAPLAYGAIGSAARSDAGHGGVV